MASRAIAASAALLLGGGGLALANVYASAGEGGDSAEGAGPSGVPVAAVSTIDCPDVGDALREVPRGARQEVDSGLADLDGQITRAYQELSRRRQAGADPSPLLGQLEQQRRTSLGSITGAIENSGASAPKNLDSMASCTFRTIGQQQNGAQQGNDGNGGQADNDSGNGNGNGNDNSNDQNQNGGENNNGDKDNQNNDGDNGGNNNGNGDGNNNGNGGQAGNGPSRDDFVDIRSVQPNVQLPRARRGASRGTFATFCGRNENGKRNPDNVIVAPGVSNGAHHMHDYVGNQDNDAFASDDDLANGATSCRNQGDRSTYYWPVLRVQNGQDEQDAGADGGGKDQNVGEIQTPAQVSMTFEGSPVGDVTAMPRFLRIITGDAKAFTNGDGNANASWSCTGFENRQLKDKYPLCPGGSKVVRTFRFQSCWDGQNIDSANHRTHVAFTDDQGRCPQGFRAVPQLVQRIVYDVQPKPDFAVDSFPEQLHKPVTDHGDFINVFDDRLMNRMVNCINRGQRCT